MTNNRNHLDMIAKYFFGGGDAAVTFANRMYVNNIVDGPANPNNNIPLANIMFCKNYLNKTNEQQDLDVHQQFTDFIIRTALYHRELDRTVKIGPIFNKMYEKLIKIFTDLLNMKFSNDRAASVKTTIGRTTVQEGGVLSLDERKKLIDKLHVLRNKQPFDDNDAPEITRITNELKRDDDELSRLVIPEDRPMESSTSLLMTGAPPPITRAIQPSSLQQPRHYDSDLQMDRMQQVPSIDNLSRQLTNLSIKIDSIRGNFVELMNKVTNLTNANEPNLRNLGITEEMSYFDALIVLLVLTNDIDIDITNENSPLYIKSIFATNVLDYSIKGIFVAKIKETFKSLLNAIYNTYTSLRTAVQQFRQGDGTELQIIINDIKKKGYKEKLILTLSNNLYEALKILFSETQYKHDRISDNIWRKNVFQNVFQQWNTLPQNTKEFFKKYLHLLEYGTSENDKRTVMTEEAEKAEVANIDTVIEWVDLVTTDGLNNLNNSNPNGYRLNLTKNHDINPNMPIFCSTLPILDSNTKYIWYTTKENTINKINSTPTMLREIYMCVYLECSNGKDSGLDAYVFKNIHQQFHIVANNTDDFKTTLPQMVTIPFVTQNNQEEYYQLQQKDYDAMGLPENHEFAKKCLLQGDFNGFLDCVVSTKYSHISLFTSAKLVAADLEPAVLNRILKSFGFEQNDTVNTWFTRFSTNLKNKNISESVINNIKYYVSGLIEQYNKQNNISQQTSSNETLVALENTAFAYNPKGYKHILLGGSGNNPTVSFSSPYDNVIPFIPTNSKINKNVLKGGANESLESKCSERYYILYDKLIKSFKRRGIGFNGIHNDISKMLDQNKENEAKFSKIFNVLAQLHKLLKNLTFEKNYNDKLIMLDFDKIPSKIDEIKKLQKTCNETSVYFENINLARNNLSENMWKILTEMQ